MISGTRIYQQMHSQDHRNLSLAALHGLHWGHQWSYPFCCTIAHFSDRSIVVSTRVLACWLAHTRDKLLELCRFRIQVGQHGAKGIVIHFPSPFLGMKHVIAYNSPSDDLKVNTQAMVVWCTLPWWQLFWLNLTWCYHHCHNAVMSVYPF